MNTKSAIPASSKFILRGREPFRSAAKSLASSCLSDSSGYDPKAVPEFEPDRGNSLCPQCSYPGVFSPRNPNPLRKLRHRSTTSLRMQSVRADFFSHFQKSGDERKPQGEPPSCVIWRNPCQEAWYFALWTPTMCALIVMDGLVGLDPVDRGPRHKKFRQNFGRIRIARSKTKRDGQTGGLMRIESIQAPLSQSQPRFDQ